MTIFRVQFELLDPVHVVTIEAPAARWCQGRRLAWHELQSRIDAGEFPRGSWTIAKWEAIRPT